MALANNLRLSSRASMGSGAAAQQPLTFVASGTLVPNNPLDTATNNFFTNRIPIVFGGPVSQIALCFDNWTISPGTDANTGSVISIDKVAIEYNGVATPITFGGARNKTLNSGDGNVQTDLINFSANRDDIAYIRVGGHCVSGTVIPCGTNGNPLDGVGRYSCTAGQYIDQVDAVGVLTSPIGANVQPSGTMFSPSAVIGRYTGPGYLAIYHIGDSIAVGLGNTKPLYFAGCGSFSSRASTLFAANKGSYAIVVAALSGDRAIFFNASSKRQAYLAYANVMTDGFLTNDVGASGGTTLAGLQSIAQATWGLARAAGVAKIVRHYLLPRCASTDSWTTTVNQTPIANWDVGGLVQQLNAWFDTQVGIGGGIDASCPFVTARSSGTATGTLWPVNGAAFFATPDGVHPDINIAMAQELRGYYNALSNNTHTNDAGVSFGTQTETQTLVKAMNVYPGATRLALIDTVISSMKTNGTWAKKDLFRIYAAHHSQAGRLNWLDPTKYLATITGLPVFTADRGYTSAGNPQLINEILDPSNAGILLTQNSAHMGAWVRSSGGAGWTWGMQNLRLSVQANGSCIFQVNDGSFGTVTGAAGFGYYVASRASSANYIPYYNGVAGSTQAIASTVITAGAFNTLNAGSGNYQICQISAIHSGSALTAGDIANDNTALFNYLHAIGAA
jgi:hypothetical protein